MITISNSDPARKPNPISWRAGDIFFYHMEYEVLYGDTTMVLSRPLGSLDGEEDYQVFLKDDFHKMKRIHRPL